MRQYIANRGYRAIPVGYSAADVDTNRLEMVRIDSYNGSALGESLTHDRPNI